DRGRASEILRQAERDGRARLQDREGLDLLEAYGIRTARTRVVPSIGGLHAAARDIGYPVVLKATGPEIVHKTDLHAVLLDIRTERDLVDGATKMKAALRRGRVSSAGFVVQEYVSGGKEVILGMTRDKVYGPFLVFGLGGIYVECLKDVACGLPPRTDSDAMRMIESIQTYPIRRGVRGEPARDVAALQDAILRLGALVSDFDSIQEMDLNPVLVLEEGRGYRAVDARIILAQPSS